MKKMPLLTRVSDSQPVRAIRKLAQELGNRENLMRMGVNLQYGSVREHESGHEERQERQAS